MAHTGLHTHTHTHTCFSPRFSSLSFRMWWIFCFWFWWPKSLAYSRLSVSISCSAFLLLPSSSCFSLSNAFSCSYDATTSTLHKGGAKKVLFLIDGNQAGIDFSFRCSKNSKNIALWEHTLLWRSISINCYCLGNLLSIILLTVNLFSQGRYICGLVFSYKTFFWLTLCTYM